MALTNRQMSGDVETLFVMADQKYAFFSSSIIKEIAALGGPVDEFTPPYVAKLLRGKFQPPAS